MTMVRQGPGPEAYNEPGQGRTIRAVGHSFRMGCDMKIALDRGFIIERFPALEPVTERCADFWGRSKKFLLCITLIYSIGISAIVRADFLYLDDLGRTLYGYRGWENFSRFSSNILSGILNGGRLLSDISPLTQLLAAVIMGLAASILAYTFSDGGETKPGALFAVIPLALNPYFLECFSYKFDSPFMAVSVLASVLPFLVYDLKPFLTVSILSLLLMFTTYQVSSGIYVMVAMFLAFWLFFDRRDLVEIRAFVARSVAAYASAALIYRFLIMRPTDDYVSSASYPLGSMCAGILANYRNFYSLVLSDFRRLWLALLAVTAIAFLVAVACRTERKILPSVALAAALLAVSSVAAIGLYVVLEKPLLAPRAMYPIGALLALVNLFIFGAGKPLPIGKLTCSYLSVCFFVFAFTYGNALAQQWDYTAFRMQCAVDDLQDVPSMSTDNTKTIQVAGSIGMSPVVERVSGTYGVLGRLVPATFDGSGWIWTTYYFYYYLKLPNIQVDQNVDLREMDLPMLSDGPYQTIYGDDTHVLIVLK